MRRSGGELHYGDGLTWWKRAQHHFEMAYDKSLEIVKRGPKEVVDTTKIYGRNLLKDLIMAMTEVSILISQIMGGKGKYV